MLLYAMAVLRGSLLPSPHENTSFHLPYSRRAQLPGLINSVCLLLQAQTLAGCCLDGRDWPCAREVVSPEGPITGSSLGAVKLDNEEQREQQRRQRQVKASNVTQDKMCLPLCQFEVQVFKSCRLRSLILSAIMRGKSVRQLNEQFFFLIFKSKVTALLQSTPHWLFFVHLHCSVSPFKLPPVVRANFPIRCYTKD